MTSTETVTDVLRDGHVDSCVEATNIAQISFRLLIPSSQTLHKIRVFTRGILSCSPVYGIIMYGVKGLLWPEMLPVSLRCALLKFPQHNPMGSCVASPAKDMIIDTLYWTSTTMLSNKISVKYTFIKPCHIRNIMIIGVKYTKFGIMLTTRLTLSNYQSDF